MMESTSKSSGDDNDGFGINFDGILTTPHEENLLAWTFLPLPFILEVVFRQRLTRGERCGVVEEEVSDILYEYKINV